MSNERVWAVVTYRGVRTEVVFVNAINYTHARDRAREEQNNRSQEGGWAAGDAKEVPVRRVAMAATNLPKPTVKADLTLDGEKIAESQRVWLTSEQLGEIIEADRLRDREYLKELRTSLLNRPITRNRSSLFGRATSTLRNRRYAVATVDGDDPTVLLEAAPLVHSSRYTAARLMVGSTIIEFMLEDLESALKNVKEQLAEIRVSEDEEA